MPVALPARLTRRIASSLSLIIAPEAYTSAESWRCAVARDLRSLVGADAALVAVESSGPAAFHAIDLDAGILRDYEDHYASVDAGIMRQKLLSIDVWCRRCLWNTAELQRSEYYNDFARPHRLLDAFGVSVLAGSRRVRISLLCARAATARGSITGRLRMLELVHPAFRIGVTLSQAAHEKTRDPMTNIIDCIDHPLALCDEAGRELHHNGALDRAAAEIDDDQLVSTIGQVTRAVALARRTTPSGGNVSVNVAMPNSEWRIRGSTLPWESSKSSAPILVSLARNEVTSGPVAAALRTRYGLTAREAQVTELLRRRRSNAEIARALGISAHTARHHTENVLLKLRLQSRNQVEERLAADEQHAPPAR